MKFKLFLLSILIANITSIASEGDFDTRKIYDKLDLNIYRNRGLPVECTNPTFKSVIYSESITYKTNKLSFTTIEWSNETTNALSGLSLTNFTFSPLIEISSTTNETTILKYKLNPQQGNSDVQVNRGKK